MASKPRFGAGIWHFATYVDRYATDGYGPAVSLIEAIDRAGRVARSVGRRSQLPVRRS